MDNERNVMIFTEIISLELPGNYIREYRFSLSLANGDNRISLFYHISNFPIGNTRDYLFYFRSKNPNLPLNYLKPLQLAPTAGSWHKTAVI